MMLLISGNTFGQDWITDSNFDEKISKKSAFGDDEMSIVIVSFGQSLMNRTHSKIGIRLKE